MSTTFKPVAGGAPGLGQRPIVPNSVKGMQEYVSGGPSLLLTNFVRSLTPAIDDLSGDWGLAVYEKMMKDPKIAGSIRLLKSAVLSSGVTFQPVIKDESEPNFQQAQELTTFSQHIVDNLTTPLDDVLRDMLDCIVYGSRVAEVVYSIETYGDFEGKIVPKMIKPKPIRNLAFVVDAFMNVIGFLAVVPGVTTNITPGQIILDKSTYPNLLPRQKFMIMSFEPTNGDPRGTSLLRPAFTPWDAKIQMLSAYILMLARFASPSLIGTIGEDAQSIVDGEGNVFSPQQYMAAALEQFENGSFIILPFGSTLSPLQLQGTGDAFMQAFDFFDAQASIALLAQTLATGDSRGGGNRAQASVHEDILTKVINGIKGIAERGVRNDVVLPAIEYNYGRKALAFAPTCTLGEVQAQDIAPLLAALAGAGYRLSASQFPDIDALLGISQRSTQDLIQEQQMMPPGSGGIPRAPAPVEAPMASENPTNGGRGNDNSRGNAPPGATQGPKNNGAAQGPVTRPPGTTREQSDNAARQQAKSVRPR